MSIGLKFPLLQNLNKIKENKIILSDDLEKNTSCRGEEIVLIITHQ